MGKAHYNISFILQVCVMNILENPTLLREEWGFTGVYNVFQFLLINIDCGLKEMGLICTTVNVWSKNKENIIN